jgi:hypothetical protein
LINSLGKNAMIELPDAKKILNNKLPDPDELNRFVEYYQKYGMEHRQNLLSGYFEGKTQDELLSDRLKAKVSDKSKRTKQRLGGYTLSIPGKVNKAIIRLIYLRYLKDEKLSRRKANKKILEEIIGQNGIQDIGQSAIARITRPQKWPEK